MVETFLENWKFPGDEMLQRKNRELIEYFQKTIFNLPVLFGIAENIDLSGYNFPEPLVDILKSEESLNPELLKCKYLLEKSFASCIESNKTKKCEEKCSTAGCKQEEHIILKIEELSHANYTYIWGLLSHEEHFILYELAKGHLLNLKNLNNISTLYSKGILTRNEHEVIGIESTAFQKFILSSIDVADIEELTRKSEISSNWNRFRLPAVLMAVSIIVFLFATQQSVLSNLNAILLSVASLIGVYLKFSGVFGGDKK
jgi:hypothetical protein